MTLYGKRVVSAWVMLLVSALALGITSVVYSAENPDISVTVDSLTKLYPASDPHPSFRDRVTSLLGDSGAMLLSFGSFDSVPLSCAVSDPQAPAFAVKRENGASVFILNETETPRSYRIEFKLAKGLYTVESLTLPGSGGSQPRRSLALGETGTRAVTGSLPGRSAIAYRITNASMDAQTRLNRISNSLTGSSIPSGRARRITNCLKQTRASIGRVDSRLGKRDRAELADEIHDGMLLASQAEAMLRNAAMQGQVSASPDKLHEDLSAFQGSLSRISAACFDLFPIISVEMPSDPVGPVMVRLTLVNRGTKPVKLVNFALTPPEGWTSSAVGYTLFAQLRPGESVSGRFALGAPSDAEPGASVAIPGDISYFSGHAAAHLGVVATVKLPLAP